jgi:hypothetical protein
MRISPGKGTEKQFSIYGLFEPLYRKFMMSLHSLILLMIYAVK